MDVSNRVLNNSLTESLQTYTKVFKKVGTVVLYLNGILAAPSVPNSGRDRSKLSAQVTSILRTIKPSISCYVFT